MLGGNEWTQDIVPRNFRAAPCYSGSRNIGVSGGFALRYRTWQAWANRCFRLASLLKALRKDPIDGPYETRRRSDGASRRARL